MAWRPIAGAPIQIQASDGTLASGYFLKFYQSGTTTPTNMATDSTGGTTLAKCQINAAGWPINGSSAVFIPHIDQKYKLALYTNATDADADTLGNADWVVDAIETDDSIFSDTTSATSGDALIGGKKLKFNNASLASSSAFTEHEFHESRPIYLDLDYGATLDGTTVITTELQAAIDDLGTGGGHIIINGSFTTAAITFPVLTSWLTIEWYGDWTTTATIEVLDRVALIGKGGSGASKGGNQFATKGPVSRIIPSGALDPVVNVTGAVKKLLKDFEIPSITAVGIRLYGHTVLGALVTLDNVHVTTANSTTAEIPLLIDHWFWGWFNDCVFFSNANSGPSIHITQTDGATSGGYSGLLYFRNTIYNSKGVKIDCPRTSGSPPVMSEFHFFEGTYENCTEPFLNVTSTNTTISNVTLDKTLVADQVAGYTGMISHTGTYGKLRSVSVNNCTTIPAFPIVVGTDILGLSINNSVPIIDYTTGWEIGQGLFSGILYDKYFGEIARKGSTMGPELIPYTSLNYSQDLSTWTPGANMTVSGAQLAPDGSSTAFNLTVSSGTSGAYVSDSVTLAVDDWVIFGVWVKATTSGSPPGAAGGYIDMAAPGGQTWESSGGSTTYLNTKNKDLYKIDLEWAPIVSYDKVTAIGTQPTTLRYFLPATAGVDADYWKPFVIHIPNSAGFDEQDIARLKQSIANIPNNVTSAGDVVAVHDNHKFRFGTGPNVIGGTAAPASGAYIVGDTVLNTNPSVDGNNMIIHGWRCTVAGSPGTWVAMYVSTVSPAT